MDLNAMSINDPDRLQLPKGVIADVSSHDGFVWFHLPGTESMIAVPIGAPLEMTFFEHLQELSIFPKAVSWFSVPATRSAAEALATRTGATLAIE